MSALEQAIEEHEPSHVFALFSGGHDSLAATAIASTHPEFTSAVHINTGTGILRTTHFVRRTCNREGWPLREYHPDRKTYEDLIREKGFGHGPKSHSTAYYWLKQRQIRRLIAAHKQPGRKIILTTGVRRHESVRRFASALAVPIRQDGTAVWVNPILDWTGSHVNRYIDAQRLERNPVVDTLHRSGECLCATLFAKGERDEVLFWAPEVRPMVERLEQVARDAGHRNCVWGVPDKTAPADQLQAFDDQPLCVSCGAA